VPAGRGEASWVDRRIFLSKDWILGRFCACAPHTHTHDENSPSSEKENVCPFFFYLTIFFCIWLYLGSFAVCVTRSRVCWCRSPVSCVSLPSIQKQCGRLSCAAAAATLLCRVVTVLIVPVHQKTGLTDKKSQKGRPLYVCVCVCESVMCVHVSVCDSS
jgi:hypothetical protein